MNNYYTLKNSSEVSFTEKRSQFIGFASPVKNEEEALAFIASIRKKHGSARHIVYAYSLKAENTARFTDDGEPSGTAGLPALELLRREELFDAVIVVVRYFGGILLGTGGLTRAYSAAAKQAVEAAERVEIIIKTTFSFQADYSDYQKLQGLLAEMNAEIISAEYSEKVSVKGQIAATEMEKLIDSAKNITNGRAVLKEK